jgi:hypothetical protein
VDDSKVFEKSLLRRHSSSIKPYLTETNKKARLQWCVDMIKRDFLVDPMFKCLFDIKSEKYYLLLEEDDPHQISKNKKYIPRLIFLCVVARPRFRDGNCILMVGLVVFHLSHMNRL